MQQVGAFAQDSWRLTPQLTLPRGTAPVGYLDGVSWAANVVTAHGWAVDPVHPSDAIEVEFTVDGPSGAPGAKVIGRARADRPREGINKLGYPGAHAFEFVVVHQFEKTLRNCHGRVARVASGGKCVRRGFRNYVQLGHGQSGLLGQAFHDHVKPRQLLSCHGLRTAAEQRNLIGEEIRHGIHDHRKGQSDLHPGGAS